MAFLNADINLGRGFWFMQLTVAVFILLRFVICDLGLSSLSCVFLQNVPWRMRHMRTVPRPRWSVTAVCVHAATGSALL